MNDINTIFKTRKLEQKTETQSYEVTLLTLLPPARYIVKLTWENDSLEKINLYDANDVSLVTLSYEELEAINMAIKAFQDE